MFSSSYSFSFLLLHRPSFIERSSRFFLHKETHFHIFFDPTIKLLSLLAFPFFTLPFLVKGKEFSSFRSFISTEEKKKREEMSGSGRGKRGITVRSVHGRNNVIAPCEYGFYEDDDSIHLLSSSSARLRGETIIPPSGFSLLKAGTIPKENPLERPVAEIFTDFFLSPVFTNDQLA